MKKEKIIIWASYVLISFSIVDSFHAFLGSLLRSSVKPAKLNNIFPCLPYCKPRAFKDKSFELGFMDQPHRIFRSYTSTNIEAYLNWLNIVENKKGKI